MLIPNTSRYTRPIYQTNILKSIILFYIHVMELFMFIILLSQARIARFRIARIGSLENCQFVCEGKFLYTTKSFMAFANKVKQKLNQRTDSTSFTWVDTIMNSRSQIPHRKTKLTRSNTKNCTIWGGIMTLCYWAHHSPCSQHLKPCFEVFPRW